jgi:hypothetical protein
VFPILRFDRLDTVNAERPRPRNFPRKIVRLNRNSLGSQQGERRGGAPSESAAERGTGHAAALTAKAPGKPTGSVVDPPVPYGDDLWG